MKTGALRDASGGRPVLHDGYCVAAAPIAIEIDRTAAGRLRRRRCGWSRRAVHLVMRETPVSANGRGR